MTQPTITERDLGAAAAVLADATESPDVLAVLTDEELLALVGSGVETVAPTPYLDEEPVVAELAAASALRSLIARGIVELPGQDEAPRQQEGEVLAGPEGTRAAQVDLRVAGLLTLRRQPAALISVTRVVSEQTTTLLEYLYPEGGVLEEFVSADGYHSFSVPLRSAVAERIAQYVDPDGVAAEDSEPLTQPLNELEADAQMSARLNDARAVSIITVVPTTGDGRILTAFAAPSELIWLDGGAANATSPSRPVSTRTLSSATLREELGAMLPEVTSV